MQTCYINIDAHGPFLIWQEVNIIVSQALVTQPPPPPKVDQLFHRLGFYVDQFTCM